MKIENYICYKKNEKIYSLGMELSNELLNKKMLGGGLPLARRNLGVPLSLWLINNKKDLIDDFINENPDKKPDKKHDKAVNKAENITDILFNTLIKLRAKPTNKKNTKKKKLLKKRKKRKKTRKNLFGF